MSLRLCKVCADWHDLEQPWPIKCERHFVKNAAPNVISDNIDPIKNHATGRVHTSKRGMSKDTRAAGCIETGNEMPKPRRPVVLDRGQRRDAIRQSLYLHRNGQGPRYDA